MLLMQNGLNVQCEIAEEEWTAGKLKHMTVYKKENKTSSKEIAVKHMNLKICARKHK